MQDPRQPRVNPPLQLAAEGQTPVHADPTVALRGVILQPLSHRGALSERSNAPTFRPSVLVHPTVFISPAPRIGDNVGDLASVPQYQVDYQVGMPASTWALRRNYRPSPAIAAGEEQI